MKSSQIEDYFSEIANQIITFSEDHTILEAMRAFKEGYDHLDEDLNYSDAQQDSAASRLTAYYESEFLPRLWENTEHRGSVEDHFPTSTNSMLLQSLYISDNSNDVGKKHYLTSSADQSRYSQSHKIYHPMIRSYLEKFEYYDIFLVDDETGHIVYSVYKEVDFGTSLLTGPYKESNIAAAFKEVRDSSNKDFVKLVDFEPYHPSYNAPAAFIASPIMDGDEKLGVLIFQMPIDRINEIMTNRHEWADVGLGESGETYIVSSDFTLRNQSRFYIEDEENYFKMIAEIGTPESTITKIKNFESTIGLQQVKTQGTEEALSGKTDTKIFEDYRGVPVLSSYKPLNILNNSDVHWVIMSEIDRDEAFSHVYDLRKNILVIFSGLLIAIILASFIISRNITKPIKRLTAQARELADGNLDVEIKVVGTDEIGVLSESFSNMQHSIKDLVHNLEEKVKERTKEIQHQKEVVEEKNREIFDSINYAKRIQAAILPSRQMKDELLRKSFIIYLPKDVVAGDFYWIDEMNDESNNNLVIFAAADCTGHGVPGAMVSVVCKNALYRSVHEYKYTDPAKILDKTREIVVREFQKSDADSNVKDGMDISLCVYNRETRVLTWAGAHNPLWIIRKDAEEVEEIKADKQPIGEFTFSKPFTSHQIQMEIGDHIYVFSDGLVDQFGGSNGKKFKSKQFKELLVSIKDRPLEEQEATILGAFENWKGTLEQVDDICVIGAIIE